MERVSDDSNMSREFGKGLVEKKCVQNREKLFESAR
jgi:hypothetical protein